MFKKLILFYCLILIASCSKTEEDKFIDYKSVDSFPLWDDVDILGQLNSKLVIEIGECDSNALVVQRLTKEFIKQTEDIRSEFIVHIGGFNSDGSLAAAGKVNAVEDYFLTDGGGNKLIGKIEELKKACVDYGLSINIEHKYYEQRWKNDFTFSEYLFKYETPEEVMSTLNRLELRILLEVNKYLVDKINNCNKVLAPNAMQPPA